MTISWTLFNRYAEPNNACKSIDPEWTPSYPCRVLARTISFAMPVAKEKLLCACTGYIKISVPNELDFHRPDEASRASNDSAGSSGLMNTSKSTFSKDS